MLRCSKFALLVYVTACMQHVRLYVKYVQLCTYRYVYMAIRVTKPLEILKYRGVLCIPFIGLHSPLLVPWCCVKGIFAGAGAVLKLNGKWCPPGSRTQSAKLSRICHRERVGCFLSPCLSMHACRCTSPTQANCSPTGHSSLMASSRRKAMNPLTNH